MPENNETPEEGLRRRNAEFAAGAGTPHPHSLDALLAEFRQRGYNVNFNFSDGEVTIQHPNHAHPILEMSNALNLGTPESTTWDYHIRDPRSGQTTLQGNAAPIDIRNMMVNSRPPLIDGGTPQAERNTTQQVLQSIRDLNRRLIGDHGLLHGSTSLDNYGNLIGATYLHPETGRLVAKIPRDWTPEDAARFQTFLPNGTALSEAAIGHIDPNLLPDAFARHTQNIGDAVQHVMALHDAAVRQTSEPIAPENEDTPSEVSDEVLQGRYDAVDRALRARGLVPKSGVGTRNTVYVTPGDFRESPRAIIARPTLLAGRTTAPSVSFLHHPNGTPREVARINLGLGGFSDDYFENQVHSIMNNTPEMQDAGAASGGSSSRSNEFSTGMNSSALPDSSNAQNQMTREEQINNLVTADDFDSSLDRTSWENNSPTVPSMAGYARTTSNSSASNARSGNSITPPSDIGRTPPEMVHPDMSEWSSHDEGDDPPEFDYPQIDTTGIDRDDYESDADYDRAVDESWADQHAALLDEVTSQRKADAVYDYNHNDEEFFAPNGEHIRSVGGQESVQRAQEAGGPSNLSEGCEIGGKYYWKPLYDNFVDARTWDLADDDYRAGNWHMFDRTGYHLRDSNSSSTWSGTSANEDSSYYKPLDNEDGYDNYNYQLGTSNGEQPSVPTQTHEEPTPAETLPSGLALPNRPDSREFKTYGRYIGATIDYRNFIKRYNDALSRAEDGDPTSEASKNAALVDAYAKDASARGSNFGGFDPNTGNHSLSELSSPETSGTSNLSEIDSIPSPVRPEQFTGPSDDQRLNAARTAHDHLISLLTNGALRPQEIPDFTRQNWTSHGTHVLVDEEHYGTLTPQQAEQRDAFMDQYRKERLRQSSRRIESQLQEWNSARFSQPISGIVPHNHVDGDELSDEHIEHEASKAWVNGTAEQDFGVKMARWKRPLTEAEQDVKDRQTLLGLLPLAVHKTVQQGKYGFLARHDRNSGDVHLAAYRLTPQGHITGEAVGHHKWNSHTGWTSTLYGDEDKMPGLAPSLAAWTMYMNNAVGGVPLRGSTNTTRFSAAFMQYLPTTRETLKQRTGGSEEWSHGGVDSITNPKCQMCFGSGRVPLQSEDLPNTPRGGLPALGAFVMDPRNRTQTQEEIEKSKEILAQAGKSEHGVAKTVGTTVPPIIDPETQKFLDTNKTDKICPACNGSGDYNPEIRMDRDSSKIGRAGWANWTGTQWQPRVVSLGEGGQVDWTHGPTPIAPFSGVSPANITETATSNVLRQMEAAMGAVGDSEPKTPAPQIQPVRADFATEEDFDSAAYDYHYGRKHNFDPVTGYHELSIRTGPNAPMNDPQQGLFLNEEDRQKANTDFFRQRHGLPPQYGGFDREGNHVLASPQIQPMRPKNPLSSNFNDMRSENLAKIDYDLVRGGNAPAHGGFGLNGHHVLSQEAQNPLTDEEKNIVTGRSEETPEPIHPSQSSFDSVPEGLRQQIISGANQDYDRVIRGQTPLNGGFAPNGHHVSSDEGRNVDWNARPSVASRYFSEPISPRNATFDDRHRFSSIDPNEDTPAQRAVSDDVHGWQSKASTDYDLINQHHSAWREYPHGAYGGFAPNGHHVTTVDANVSFDRRRIQNLQYPELGTPGIGAIHQNHIRHDLIRVAHGLSPQYGQFDNNGFHTLDPRGIAGRTTTASEQENTGEPRAVEVQRVTMPFHPDDVPFRSSHNRALAMEDTERVLNGQQPIHGGWDVHGRHILSSFGDSSEGMRATHLLKPQEPQHSTFRSDEDRDAAEEDYARVMNGQQAINGGFSKVNNGHHVLSNEGSGLRSVENEAPNTIAISELSN